MTARSFEADADFYVVEVEWVEPGMPRLIGPFMSRDEAAGWGSLYANGTWNVAPLASPYGGVI